MSFDPSAYLRRATSRAKSDVANKLISMFLHDVSRRAAAEIGLSVTDEEYIKAVVGCFGNNCAYCGRLLEIDRAAVEHLDGMNRFRVGLHIPGNVVLACNRCNREKRRDDSSIKLSLAEDAWQCFLSHDSSRCGETCKTCAYWRSLLPEVNARVERMRLLREKISAFRGGYPEALKWSSRAREILHAEVEVIYRECQVFATTRIKRAVDELFEQLHES